MDRITLQSFLVAAETGSFTQAADRVGRTQSAVSQQMAKLEALLGKSLFHRGRQLRLTSDGELFLPYARRLYALHQEVLDRFTEPELEGEVRFGLPEDFASVFLSGVLTDFTRSHPRISLNIECDLTLNLLERFRRREFDLVLVKLSQPEDFPNGLEVWTEQLEWVGEPGLVEGAGSLPLVLAPQPCVYRSRALESLQRTGVEWRIVFCSPSYAGMTAAVQAGMGITVLPRTMIPDSLEVIKPGMLPPLSDTHASLLRHDPLNAAVTSLQQFVVNRLNH